ncbi:PDZ domain-containing protein [Paracoccus sp. YIM 132242]|uniref:PDZ domain-containing protein n=1 Tax=Paracoccus lichenicola TaxID=2665644 RepID=A0A6L6HJX7_9RHOB|nr:trypsin-like peptidase domain-containing protein [Paracoccus lichenicola]MTD99463.1 PDZ domain-containing protein [Paracoccus lichenicola]
MAKDGFLPRLALVTLAGILLILVWRGVPLLELALRGPVEEPRAVLPRGDLAANEQTTIALFEGARDSVVSITTESRVVDFWTRNAHDVPRGSGSGFIWDAGGHVVTNNHVIEGATGALVRLADGRAYPARLVGTAPEHDLAVLRIDAGAEQPLPLAVGVSGDLRVGQSVFAIGNPFGLDWTLTTGIVSALDRELPGQRGAVIRGLIQTDAAINPGNSGGPLLDSAGRLIGVNTAIYSPSGSSAGIGFAVPVDTVNRVVPQLIATGRYAPPTLGVAHDPRGDALLARAGISGVMVLDVTPGSPADAAGLRPARMTRDGRLGLGDVIVSLDDAPLKGSEDLQAALDLRQAGETVRLGILRDSRRIEMTATLAAGT